MYRMMFFLLTQHLGLLCGALILMCVPSIAPITLGKALHVANPLKISSALSPSDHLIKRERFTIAFVTLLTVFSAVAFPTLNI